MRPLRPVAQQRWPNGGAHFNAVLGVAAVGGLFESTRSTRSPQAGRGTGEEASTRRARAPFSIRSSPTSASFRFPRLEEWHHETRPTYLNRPYRCDLSAYEHEPPPLVTSSLDSERLDSDGDGDDNPERLDNGRALAQRARLTRLLSSLEEQVQAL